MKKILLLLILPFILSCTVEPLKFRTKVEVIKGFYKGCHGEVMGYSGTGLSFYYEIKFENCKGYSFTANLRHKEVECLNTY